MELEGYIRNITYQPHLTSRLKEVALDEFVPQSAPTYGLLKSETSSLAYSQWVSPKRTRSYPFARMYQTYSSPKKITIIPIIKDEGADGDLDKIQYSTISWLNLLNIYLVLGYYDSAEKNSTSKQKHCHKLTRQRFHLPSIQEQIAQINNYHQSALHWNMNLCETRLATTLGKALTAYRDIAMQTRVTIHNQVGMQNYLKTIQKEYQQFRTLSLQGSQSASQREIQTLHKQEYLSEGDKATIVIKNYLGGLYYLTVDEVILEQNRLILQESKNATKGKLPSSADIRDGLFKLILYTNLDSLYHEKKKQNFVARLRLTGKEIKGTCLLPHITAVAEQKFIQENALSKAQKILLESLRKEAVSNNLEIEVVGNG